ncbi:LytR/AlgR family response regulator transcription factor [Aquimarina rubra]|uniref:LytR/AlgR family response regulator transcription factor n=1 Tax=Aquimarina rubra TaxID=1920033 RepID=A0ABW5LAK7_9FLAO
MIKVVIIEDEAPAVKKLKNYLDKTDEPLVIVKEIATVTEALNYFQTQPDIDLIFSDIELRDGNVFEVYNQIKIVAPIIFITAYDQFWMNAFETSGIEYLLKPFSFARFEKALQKYDSLKNNLTTNQNDIFKKLDDYYQSKLELKPTYKEYIPIKSNSGIYFLKTEDVVFFQADYGIISAYDSANKKHLLNQTSLKEINEMLNPSDFFKINRSELVNRNYIEKINRYAKNTVAIHVKLKSHILKTSQASTAQFNSWMGL